MSNWARYWSLEEEVERLEDEKRLEESHLAHLTKRQELVLAQIYELSRRRQERHPLLQKKEMSSSSSSSSSSIAEGTDVDSYVKVDGGATCNADGGVDLVVIGINVDTGNEGWNVVEKNADKNADGNDSGNSSGNADGNADGNDSGNSSLNDGNVVTNDNGNDNKNEVENADKNAEEKENVVEVDGIAGAAAAPSSLPPATAIKNDEGGTNGPNRFFGPRLSRCRGRGACKSNCGGGSRKADLEDMGNDFNFGLWKHQDHHIHHHQKKRNGKAKVDEESQTTGEDANTIADRIMVRIENKIKERNSFEEICHYIFILVSYILMFVHLHVIELWYPELKKEGGCY